MFKRIAEQFLSSKSRYDDRIRVTHGEILAQDDSESILFFMYPNLKWGGGLNAAILEKAGPELRDYIAQNVRKPHSGDVYALPPFKTGYKQIYLAILEQWDGGIDFEDRDLMKCYRGAIQHARKNGIKTIAIPAMGRDKRDFPHIRFARLAVKAITAAFGSPVERITVYCADQRTYRTYLDLLAS